MAFKSVRFYFLRPSLNPASPRQRVSRLSVHWRVETKVCPKIALSSAAWRDWKKRRHKALQMFTEVCRKNILALAEAYGEVMGGHSLSWVSNHIYGNGTFFREFAARRCSISVDRYGEMLGEIAAKWPIDKIKDWPDLRPLYFTRESLLQQRHIIRGEKVPNRISARHV